VVDTQFESSQPHHAVPYKQRFSRGRPNSAELDGNKRASLVVTELFLELNGYELAADDAAAVTTWLDLAQGNIDEQALAAWIRERIKPA
jgi:hypothetical protein